MCQNGFTIASALCSPYWNGCRCRLFRAINDISLTDLCRRRGNLQTYPKDLGISITFAKRHMIIVKQDLRIKYMYIGLSTNLKRLEFSTTLQYSPRVIDLICWLKIEILYLFRPLKWALGEEKIQFYYFELNFKYYTKCQMHFLSFAILLDVQK